MKKRCEGCGRLCSIGNSQLEMHYCLDCQSM